MTENDKTEILRYRLASALILASKILGYGICQMDDSDGIVLSRKIRYVLFPETSTLGVCIWEYTIE